MKRVLFTGGTGFVGKNVIPILNGEFEILAPSRSELNLKSMQCVKEYLLENDIQVVVHCANPNSVKNKLDLANEMLKDSLQIFMNLYQLNKYYDKMIYLGSGAEYDKRFDIVSVKEEQIGRNIPDDDYGFAKFIMNELARNSENIFNLRLFACYGPYDFKTKFITHAIHCCLKNEEITIRQDCYFDYLHVFDLAKIIRFFIKESPQKHDYNICSGKKIRLSQIADEVKRQMNYEKNIVILKEGLNREYTADNQRLKSEFAWKDAISINEGIKKQIAWEKTGYEETCSRYNNGYIM